MATVHPHPLVPAASGRRQEILELHARLAGSSHAQVLGVPPGAGPATVREAFVALARRLHPDTLAPGDADLSDQLQAIFIRVNDAYRTLGGDHPTARAAERSPEPPRETAVPTVAPRPEPLVVPPPKPLVAPPPPPGPEKRRARVEEVLRSAEASIARREVEEAVSELHDVLSQADGDQRRRIRLVLASAYVGDPRWRRYGLSLLTEMLGETPDDADALTTLGVLYHREGLMARAEATLRRALASDPGHVEARIHLRAVTAALKRRRAPAEAPPPERRGLVARLLSIGRQ